MTSDRRKFKTLEEFEAFRAEVHADTLFVYGDWQFDWIDRRVQPGNIYLAPRLADVLRVLCESLTYPLSAGELARKVAELNGGEKFDPDLARVNVMRLRRMIGEERIWSHEKSGYLFVPFPSKGNKGGPDAA